MIPAMVRDILQTISVTGYWPLAISLNDIFQDIQLQDPIDRS